MSVASFPNQEERCFLLSSLQAPLMNMKTVNIHCTIQEEMCDNTDATCLCAERTCVWGQAERNLFQQKLRCCWILYFSKCMEMAANSTTEQTKHSSIPRPPKTL